MRSVALTLILILAHFATPAGSGSNPVSSDLPDIDTSQGFLEMCASVDKKPTDQSQVELFQSGYCIGWMAGLTKGIHLAEATHQTSEKNAIFCPPLGNSYGQMIHITRKFIADHPEMEHLSMGVIASAALAEAFPCKESKWG
jgi:Rap1a immunity proteins